jgi:hypothetical protein
LPCSYGQTHKDYYFGDIILKRISNLLVAFAFLLALPFASFAEEDPRGVERVGTGTKDIVTSPGKIVDGVSEGTEKHGAAGTVTGTAKGSVNAAGQAAKGAVDVGTGAVQSVLDPLTGK